MNWLTLSHLHQYGCHTVDKLSNALRPAAGLKLRHVAATPSSKRQRSVVAAFDATASSEEVLTYVRGGAGAPGIPRRSTVSSENVPTI
jgi:hypothetical protein